MGRKPNAGKEGQASIEETHMPNSKKDMTESFIATRGGAKVGVGQTHEAPTGLSSPKKKAPKDPHAIVRRSARIQKAVGSSLSKVLEPVIEETDHSGNGGGDERQSQNERVSPEVDLFEKSSRDKTAFELNASHKTLEEKVDCLSQLVGAQEKMIEGLTNRSYQVGLKLDEALGRLDACEKVAYKFSELIEKLKDAILCSDLPVEAEMTFNLSPQAIVKVPEPIVECKTSATKRRKVVSRK